MAERDPGEGYLLGLVALDHPDWRYVWTQPGLSSLRDLVETEAARRRLPPRWVGIWALHAITQNQLPPRLPYNVSLDARLPQGPGTLRSLIADNMLAVERGSTDLARFPWTKRLMFDTEAFRNWLDAVQIAYRREAGAKRGPKSRRDCLRRAFNEIVNDGASFKSKKDAHGQVMKKIGRQTKGERGWGYKTFIHHCADLLEQHAL